MQMNETVFSKYFPEYAQNPLVPSALPSVTALPDYWGSFSRDFLRHWLESVLSDSASSGSIDERFCASLEQYLGTMPDWRIEDR